MMEFDPDDPAAALPGHVQMQLFELLASKLQVVDDGGDAIFDLGAHVKSRDIQGTEGSLTVRIEFHDNSAERDPLSAEELDAIDQWSERLGNDVADGRYDDSFRNVMNEAIDFELPWAGPSPYAFFPGRFDELIAYWVRLRSLATPSGQKQTRRPRNREFGHPAEWASDKAAEIVDAVVRTRNHVAGYYSEANQPTRGAESARLNEAVAYLRSKKPAELRPVFAGSAEALRQRLIHLHKEIGDALGVNEPTESAACPACGEVSAKLFSNTRGEREVRCTGCHYRATRDDYAAAVSIAMTTLLASDDDKPEMASGDSEPMTIKEAVCRFGIKRSTIDTWIRRGDLQKLRENGNGLTLIDGLEVKRLKDRQKKQTRR